MIEVDFLKHLDRLSLLINKKVTSNYIGERPSIYTGQGIIFKDHRIYAPGDDYRSIDWRVYARTDRLHVKRYEEERNLVVHILVDFSASMNFGEHVKKFEYASMMGMGFAYMAMKNNEKFVLSTFSDHLELFKPSKGKKQIVAILDYLRNKQAEGVSQFEDSLAGYVRVIHSRSLIVIISDFLYDPEEIRRALYRFKHHEIVLVQVLDETEKNLDIAGEFRLRDLETKGMLRTFISPFMRRSYLNKLDEHNRRIGHIVSELKGKFFTVTTDKPVYDSFYKILNR